VHSDIWGPYRIPALNGAAYFITFTDDYSRKTWVYVVSTKDQLRTVFIEFRARVELETGLRVKIIRCDNGSEYKGLDNMFRTFYGVQFEFTTAYTPWQNAVSERLNRALVQAARAMMAHAGLPPELWAEAVMAASYIRNRTPVGPEGMTPEEAYSGKKPSVEHLRAWGCAVYHTVAPEQNNKDKLAPNGLRTALVGYMPTSKQYRLYDPKRKRIIISTSPRFVEGQRLHLPGIEAESTETVGFDPMEAGPQTGPSPKSSRQTTRQPPVAARSDQTSEADASGSYADLAPDQTPSSPGQTPPVLEQGHTGEDTDAAVSVNALARDTNQEAYRTPPASTSPEDGGRNCHSQARTALRRAVSPLEEEDEDDPGRQLLAEAELAIEEPAVRRSGRERRAPNRFEGALYAAIEKIPIPRDFKEALGDPSYGADWAQAAQEELAQLQSLGTWELSELPKGKRLLGCRWVFNVKYTPTGLVDRFKARLVAQGFSQVPGDDFLETFSPTIRAESLRLLLAIGAYEDLEIRQVDVVSAYPRSDLHAEIYMRPPEGLDCPKGSALRIQKSLYGLKQSGREWYIEACKGLKGLGLEPLFADPSVFATTDRKLLVGLYVDDMLILAKDPAVVNRAVAFIQGRWQIKDLGDVGQILGIRVTRDRKRRLLFLDQGAYIDQLVKRFGLEKAKPFPTPAADRTALLRSDGTEQQADQHLYQQGVGSLAWLAVCTRPDVAYVWGQLSQSCATPTVRNWNGVLHAIRYVKGTRDLRLVFGGIGGDLSPQLHGYCDADYAGDHTDRHSVSGHLFILNKGLVSWSSAKQRCVATSTTEAEYIALCDAAKQSQWLRMLLLELQREALVGKDRAVQLFGDNQACLAIAEDPMAHKRTKHIDVRYHYTRQLIAFGKVRVAYVPTADMLADVLTKPLPLPAFKRCTRDFLVPPAK
jgi:hypothetical protein